LFIKASSGHVPITGAMNDKPRQGRPMFGEGPPQFWPWMRAGFGFGIGFSLAVAAIAVPIWIMMKLIN
jgi:hypothetical protein